MSIINNDTRASIISTAAHLFNRYGYEKTSLRDIAQSLGKARTSIYKYFRNKEDIFQNIVKDQTLTYIERLEKGILNYNSATDKLRLYCHLKFDLVHLNINNQYGLKRNITHHKRMLTDIKESSHKREHSMLKDIIRFGVETGEFQSFSNKEIRLLPVLLNSALCGIINDFTSQNITANTRQLKELAETLVIKSIRK